ncbi:hypothetical protein, partial [Pseudomonas sp. G(2018)]|uniref:hypothetical protein n=1 Tax=Pseudomonas sp. G(2018) TaxID=2502242 RepID=UPI001C49AE56
IQISDFRFQISDFRKAKCPDKSGHLLLAGADCVFTQPASAGFFICRSNFDQYDSRRFCERMKASSLLPHNRRTLID